MKTIDSSESMKTILFLEGGEYSDYETAFNYLKEIGYKVSLLSNLYESPDKLEQIVTIDPDCLFIGTTGMRHEKRKILIEKFNSIKYIPRNIMFANRDSARVYVGTARELKNMALNSICHLTTI